MSQPQNCSFPVKWYHNIGIGDKVKIYFLVLQKYQRKALLHFRDNND